MKEAYVEATLDIINISASDVIVTSGDCPIDGLVDCDNVQTPIVG